MYEAELMFKEALEDIETCKTVAYLLMKYSNGDIAEVEKGFAESEGSHRFEEIFEETAAENDDHSSNYRYTRELIEDIEKFVEECEHVKIVSYLSPIDFGVDPEERKKYYCDTFAPVMDMGDYGRFLAGIDCYSGFYYSTDMCDFWLEDNCATYPSYLLEKAYEYFKKERWGID